MTVIIQPVHQAFLCIKKYLVIGQIQLEQTDTAIECIDIVEITRFQVADPQPHARQQIEIIEGLDVTSTQRDALHVFELRCRRASLCPQLRVENELLVEQFQVPAFDCGLDRLSLSSQRIFGVAGVHGGRLFGLWDQLFLEMDPLSRSRHLPSSLSYHSNQAALLNSDPLPCDIF